MLFIQYAGCFDGLISDKLYINICADVFINLLHGIHELLCVRMWMIFKTNGMDMGLDLPLPCQRQLR